MITFLSTTTPAGDALVERARSARSSADITVLIQLMHADLAASLNGEAGYTEADRFNLYCVLGDRTVGHGFARAVFYDTAGQTAFSARAYPQALLALQRAEEARPSPKRRKQILAVRQLLARETVNTSGNCRNGPTGT